MGRAVGQVSVSVRPSFTPDSNGPLPPPENDTATVAAFGTTDPSAAKTRVGSVGIHAPLRHTRTGDP